MADHTAPLNDGSLPTWLTAVLSVLTTVAGLKGLNPAWRWASKRIDARARLAAAREQARQQAEAAERAASVTLLLDQLRTAQEELVELRQDLGEEREMRMALAVENATLAERVDGLTKALARAQRDCQRQITALGHELRELRREREEHTP